MFIVNFRFFFIIFLIIDSVFSLICWSCSNNPHDTGKNPCPEDLKIELLKTEPCLNNSCFLKMAQRDKGPLRPIKGGCLRSNLTKVSLPGVKCQSGIGVELSDKNSMKHFTSNYCIIQCDSDLCSYRLAKKFS